MRKLFAIILILYANYTFALTKVDINKGNNDPLPIALNDLTGKDEASKEIAERILYVVSNDLKSTGLFRPIDKKAFIENIEGDKLPNFQNWRAINATALLTGETIVNSDDIEVVFRLWDVITGHEIKSQKLNANLDNWRRISHLVSDQVYEALTGEQGYFDTRIVYVSETGPATKRVKRLAIMDQDGANHKFITDGTSMALTPRFSPIKQEIMYLSFASKVPRVFLRDIQTGREKMLGEFAGMTFAPRFSPDGKKAIMSLAHDGMTDLYMLDLQNLQQTRLTKRNAINTSPTFAPDGKKIAFNSDRSGRPQIYVMNSDGSDQKRISFGNGSYGNPVWSPRGDLIAFTKIIKGQFYIGVMKPDGSRERTITQGYLVEGQTWSPNGRVLMFTKQNKPGKNETTRSVIHSIDLTGYNERVVETPLDASDPAWSPPMPI